jgi:hypothetical protein
MSSTPVINAADVAPVAENVLETSTNKRTLTHILSDLKTFLDVGRALYNELKPYEKEFSKMQKKMDQEVAKKEKAQKNKKDKAPLPERLYHISPQFAEFMGMSADTTMTRKQVMRSVYDYLKTNNLQNPEKKIQYFLDDKLSKLFEGSIDEASGKSFILSKDVMVQYHKHILAPAENAGSAPTAPAVPAVPAAPKPAVTVSSYDVFSENSAGGAPAKKPVTATASAEAPKPVVSSDAASAKPVVKKVVGKK